MYAEQVRAEQIIDNLTLLATAYNEPLSPERIEVYTSVLFDLSSQELTHGFRRALRETKWWPKPSELLEFCTGRASDMEDKLTTDRAWNWVRQYIEWFGVQGKTRWLIQDRFFNALSIEAAVRNDTSEMQFTVTAPFYEVVRYDPPELPPVVEQTLIAMAGSVKMGLTRISDAKRGWNSGESCALSSKDSAFVRKDFDEYCSRALAATNINSPQAINPTLELPGKAKPSFRAPTRTSMAFRIRRNASGCEALRLTLEEATSLHRAGLLPDSLYAETVHHYRKLEREEEWRNTPMEFNAVFTAPYDRRQLYMLERDSWPELATFNVEDANGTELIRSCFPMAIGDLTLQIGDCVRFTATPAELRFSQKPRYVFDLSKACHQYKKKEQHNGSK